MVLEVLFVGGELSNLRISFFVQGVTFGEHKWNIQPQTRPKLILTLLEVLDKFKIDLLYVKKYSHHARLVHQTFDHPPKDVLDLIVQHFLLHVQNLVTHRPDTLNITRSTQFSASYWFLLCLQSWT